MTAALQLLLSIANAITKTCVFQAFLSLSCRPTRDFHAFGEKFLRKAALARG
jgi:hypothetical protein